MNLFYAHAEVVEDVANATLQRRKNVLWHILCRRQEIDMYKSKIRTYKQAEEYILEVPKFTTKNPLEETRGFYQFLQKRDYKEESLGKIIHIAGTNGKGSVCSFVNSVCLESGYHVGMFTSPHLITMRERFIVDGKMVSEEDFLEAFLWLEKAIDTYHEICADYQPTFFERLFFMSLYLFQKAGVDISIMETGLGGRLDTTNVMEKPSVCVITEIGLDHMAYLGDTIEQIAGEKAGIIKQGIPVVYADKRSESSVVIERIAKELGACCHKVSKNAYEINEIQKKSIDFSVYSRYYDYVRLVVETAAVYQVENAAIAMRALEVLKGKEQLTQITQETMQSGIRKMRWPGRMEEILPQVFIDGAHNEDGVEAFLASVKAGWQQEGGKRCFLIFSAVNDKKYDKMIEMLAELSCVTDFCITRIPGQRGVRIDELEKQFRIYTNRDIHVFEEISDAFDFCMHQKGEKDVVYIVGSLYLAGLVEDLVKGSL